MGRDRQEEKTMGKEQANIMLQVVQLLQEEAFISVEERRKTEELIKEQVRK